MWDRIAAWLPPQPEAFCAGLVLVLLYQAARFNELNLDDPLVDKYKAAMTGMRTRDVSSSFSYWVGLISFLFVSAMIYYAVCSVSPDVAYGLLELLKVPADEKVVKGEIPYPLYVAAIFIGFTQPLPGIARVGEVQRSFFQRRIDVPLSVVDMAEKISDQIVDHGERQRVETAIVKLLDPSWLDSLKGFADTRFLNRQLLKLGHISSSSDPKKSEQARVRDWLDSLSYRELAAALEKLVLFTLAAVTRKTGRRGRERVAQRLGVEPPKPIFDFAYFFLSGILFCLVVVVIWVFLDSLRDLIRWARPQPPPQFAWPLESYIGQELLTIAGPFVCTALLVIYVWEHRFAALDDESRIPRATFAYMATRVRQYAFLVVGLFAAAVIALILINSYLYGVESFSAQEDDVIPIQKLFLFSIQAFAPVSLCLVLLMKLEESRRGIQSVPLWWCVVVILAAATIFSTVYMVSYYRFEFSRFVAVEPWVFAVLANSMVALGLFLSVLTFLRRPKRKVRNKKPDTVPTFMTSG